MRSAPAPCKEPGLVPGSLALEGREPARVMAKVRIGTSGWHYAGGFRVRLEGVEVHIYLYFDNDQKSAAPLDATRLQQRVAGA
jgi:uncharacterized protein YecE (DUF72 family)